MSTTDEILGHLDINRLAQQLGAEPSEVEAAARNALPTLLMGLGANAQDPAGEASIIGALDAHDPNLLDEDVDPAKIDTDDGARITHHIFGSNEDAVVDQLGGLGGGNDLVQKLLPMLAPLVMSWLAKRMQGPSQQEASSGSGLLSDILGRVFDDEPTGEAHRPGEEPRREAQTSEPRSGGGMLGDLLGGLLGRGRR